MRIDWNVRHVAHGIAWRSGGSSRTRRSAPVRSATAGSRAPLRIHSAPLIRRQQLTGFINTELDMAAAGGRSRGAHPTSAPPHHRSRNTNRRRWPRCVKPLNSKWQDMIRVSSLSTRVIGRPSNYRSRPRTPSSMCHCHTTRHHRRRATTPTRQSGRTFRRQDSELLDDYSGSIEKGVLTATELLDKRPVVFLHVPCPRCGQRHAYRDSSGERARTRALRVLEAGCKCPACGAFCPPERFEWLVRLLGCLPLRA